MWINYIFAFPKNDVLSAKIPNCKCSGVRVDCRVAELLKYYVRISVSHALHSDTLIPFCMCELYMSVCLCVSFACDMCSNLRKIWLDYFLSFQRTQQHEKTYEDNTEKKLCQHLTNRPPCACIVTNELTPHSHRNEFHEDEFIGERRRRWPGTN